MTRTNVTDNCHEKKDTFDTENVDYFDDGIELLRFYSQILVNILVAIMPMIALALMYL